MTIYHYPGGFRVGVLNGRVERVADPEVQVVDPKLQLLVLLQGHQRFFLDRHEIELDARQRPAAVLMRIARPTTVRFVLNEGAPLRKIALAMPVDWLAQVVRGGSHLPHLSGDLDWHLWRPASEMVRIAACVVAERAELSRMTLGLELLEAALADLTLPGVRRGDDPQIEAVRRYMRRHAGAAPSAPDVARACGMGLRSLERRVARNLGCSLGTFLRDLRLDAAVEALRDHRSSVAEAAWIAGYSSAANFATALRRARGVCPSDLRGEP